MTAPPESVGAIAPLNTKLVGSEIVPVCLAVTVLGMSSYQRTTLPAPPATVWAVHTASTPPALGSAAATACMRRLSLESIWSVLPGWVTLGGSAKEGTVGSPMGVSVGVLALPVTCQIIMFLPLPENGVASSAATT